MSDEKVTAASLTEKKARGEIITALTAYDYSTAVLLNQVGIDMILVGDSLGMVILGYDSTLKVTMDDMIHHTRAVARGNSRALLVGDMPFLSFSVSVEEAIRNAGRFVQAGGAEAVKIEGGEKMAETIRAIIRAGIPVLGHIGFTPQQILNYGKSRVEGKDEEAIERLLNDAGALEDAGVFAIVLECLPVDAAARVTESVKVPTIGIGAGIHCDGQILVTNDLLGLYDKMRPKFAKQYANLNQIGREALAEFVSEVKEGKFPDSAHSYHTSKQK